MKAIKTMGALEHAGDVISNPYEALKSITNVRLQDQKLPSAGHVSMFGDLRRSWERRNQDLSVAADLYSYDAD
ncbi:hypothetical protein CRT23_26430 [Methylobacterium sp. V23]|nr:hypothetical protein CRT23_26430 [Methylobacterium sp. V23]